MRTVNICIKCIMYIKKYPSFSITVLVWCCVVLSHNVEFKCHQLQLQVLKPTQREILFLDSLSAPLGFGDEEMMGLLRSLTKTFLCAFWGSCSKAVLKSSVFCFLTRSCSDLRDSLFMVQHKYILVYEIMVVHFILVLQI